MTRGLAVKQKEGIALRANREDDTKMIEELDKKELTNLLFLQLRNMWSVDGLYFLGIEERFGTKGAVDIDSEVWDAMGTIEAKRLRSIMGIKGSGIRDMMRALRLSSWALDLEEKDISIEDDRAVLKNPNCRVQNTRTKKGLSEFPCKGVRWGYLRAFARIFNEDIVVNCTTCPPDKHPENLWCHWEFSMKEKGK